MFDTAWLTNGLNLSSQLNFHGRELELVYTISKTEILTSPPAQHNPTTRRRSPEIDSD